MTKMALSRLTRLPFAQILLCLIVATCPLAAQQVYDGNNNLPPYGSFHGSDFDTVNLVNGNLHMSIPVLTVFQRGKPITYRFIYDTQAFQRILHNVLNHVSYTVGFSLDYTGWRLTSPFNWNMWVTTGATVKCSDGGSYVPSTYALADPDGAKHTVALYTVNPPTASCSPGQTLKGPTLDGSDVFVDFSGSAPVITLGDGAIVGSNRKDSNGNLSSASADTLNRNLLVTFDASQITYTTPLGKTAMGPQYSTWTYKDSGGIAHTWRVDYTAIDTNSGFCTGFTNCTDAMLPKVVPKQLTLPTGLIYKFAWFNASGAQLQKVTLPTGGTISYTYTPNCFISSFQGGQTSDCRQAVASRSVNDGTSTAAWQYTYNGQTSTTVTDPYSNDEVHSYTQLGGSGQSVETKLVNWSGLSTGSGSVLRTTVNTYGYNGNPVDNSFGDARVIRQDTTLENSQVNSTETDYTDTFSYVYEGVQSSGTRLNPTATREYDYGSGARGPSSVKLPRPTSTKAILPM